MVQLKSMRHCKMNQKELDELTAKMKDLIPLQRMLKMGESRKLQTELHQLRTKEAEYLKNLQPWQEQVSEIVVKFNAKLMEFQATQMIFASLLIELPTTDFVNTTRECVHQMTQDITMLQDTYMKISTKIWENVRGPKDDTSGLGMILEPQVSVRGLFGPS